MNVFSPVHLQQLYLEAFPAPSHLIDQASFASQLTWSGGGGDEKQF
jgi:hypothetical protein